MSNNIVKYHVMLLVERNRQRILVIPNVSLKTFFVVALPYDDWCYCIDSIHPYTSTVHEGR